jgi:hypothetical protein
MNACPEQKPLEIPARLLQAALLVAARDDFRFYLNGVRVEVKGSAGRLIATDGHCLFAAQFEVAGGAGDIAITIPVDLLDMIPLGKRSGRILSVPFVIDGDRITTTGLRVDLSSKAVEGKFPDWRAIVPKDVTGETAHYAPRMFALAARIGARLGYTFPVLRQNGNAPGIASYGDEAMFLAMPLRLDDATKVPAWAQAVPHA